MKAGPLKAVLLDIDGTLVDSNDQHAEAWAQAFRECGHSVSFERVRRLIGKGGDKVLQEIAGIDEDSAEGKKISARRGHLYKMVYFPRVRPFPGAAEVLHRMHGDGLRLVAATSAEEEEMNASLALTGAPKLFFRATSSDEASHSKPDPDIIQAALDKAECTGEEALMLGDTPYDIQAAAAASVPTVALRSGGWSDGDLSGAIAIYDDVADLLAHYEECPFHAVRAGRTK